MNPFASLGSGIEGEVKSLFSGITASAGSAATRAISSNPTVQTAIEDVEAKLQSAQNIAVVASVVASAVVLFYYLPRFESPVPRIFRRKRR